MSEMERDSGIDVIGNVPWGTHFCFFYEAREDLIDTLASYFEAGLKNNEFCMCVASEPIDANEVKKLMSKAIPGFEQYFAKGQIEIIPYTEWYLIGGVFDSKRVLAGWVEKMEQALARGFSGLRLSGNTFWLEKGIWNDLMDYEKEVNDTLGKYRIIALCTYSLDKCDANEVVDVASTHEFALIKREDEWRIIENSESKEIRKALSESDKRFRATFEQAAAGMCHMTLDGRFMCVNQKFCDITGYPYDEMIKLSITDITYPPDLPEEFEYISKLLTGKISTFSREKRYIRKDGSLIWVRRSCTWI